MQELNMSTYEITAEINEIFFNLINSETGEVSPEVAARLDALHLSLEQKLTNWGRFILNLQGQLEAVKNARKSMQERERTLSNFLDRNKAAVLNLCAINGIKKITKDPCLTLSVAKTAPSVEVLDEKQIPAEYWTTPAPVLNKMKLKEDLKMGLDIPGAKLSEPGLSLRIK